MDGWFTIQVILQEDSLKEGTYRLQPWSLKGSWSTRASRSRSSSRRPFHGLPGLPRAVVTLMSSQCGAIGG